MKSFNILICVLACSTSLASDQIPGAPQKKPIALVNAVVHQLTGPPVEKGVLVFDQGKITAIGADIKPPENAEVIDLQGKHVYPGLIESHSQLGLTEISSTRATLDFAESGSINPNVSAHVAVNPDSELIPVTRANGVLIAVSAPSGGLVSGKASVMQLDGWTYEDMTLRADVGLVINWPQMQSPRRPSSRSTQDDEKKSEERPDELKSLRTLFEQARAYGKARGVSPTTQNYDSRLEAMQSVVNGTVPLIVAADRAPQIQSAVAFGVEQNVRVIIFGGYDSESCGAAEAVQRAGHYRCDSRDPRRTHDDYDASYTLPERLRKAGVRFCISGSGRSESWNTRNLPYQAATAAAYGLPYNDAMRAITVYPAEILGIADRVGTLEVGKDATLFVCNGDPLETETQVSEAWIQGGRLT
ncbi:MAG: amidohydrolase family protein [Planctomycetaceae bacterium]